jgi:type I restriction enzyme S subunit
MKTIERLGNITECLDSKRVPLKEKDRSLRKGDIPYYGTNGQVGWIDDYLFYERLLLLAEDGGAWGQGKKCSYIIEGKSWVNNHAHVLRSNGKVDLGYLNYYLNHADLDSFITGTTRGKLNRTRMNDIKVPLSPLSEQKQIVQTLDTADTLRQKRKEQLNLLDDYLKSVFFEMFGDSVVNEKNWKTKKFNEVGTLDRGISKNRPRNAPELLGGPYPLIQTGDVSNSGGYIKEFKSTYSELGLKQSKVWPVGTLCITIAANIAKTGILTFEACFPDSVVGFAPNNLVRTEYVQWWMSFLQKILEEKAPESAQKNINLGILRNLDIPIPAIELQNKFVEIIEQVEQTKQKMRASLDEMDNHFNALMQGYFG